MLRARLSIATATMIVYCSIAGCGSSDTQPRVAVQGEVFATGVLEIDGNIALTPIEGGPACGASVDAGKFQIAKQRGPIPGLYRARLNVRKVKMDPSVSPETNPPDSFQPMRLKVPEGGGKLTLRFITTD